MTDFNSLNKIGQGACKRVYDHPQSLSTVVCGPVAGRENDFKREVQTVRQLAKAIPNSTHLLREQEDAKGVPEGGFAFPKAKGDLQQRITPSPTKRAITVQECMNIAKTTFHGLKEMHQALFLHRDLKTDNILEFENQDYKLGDFGHVCKVSSSDQVKINTGNVKTKPPESGAHMQGEMYSAGLILADLINATLGSPNKSLSDLLVQAKIQSEHRPKNKLLRARFILADLLRLYVYKTSGKVVFANQAERKTLTDATLSYIHSIVTLQQRSKKLSPEETDNIRLLLWMAENLLQNNPRERLSAEEAASWIDAALAPPSEKQ